MLQCGIILASDNMGMHPTEVRDYAQEAEGLGYWHLLAPEHVLGIDRAYHKDVELELTIGHDTAFREPFTLFSYIAAVTERIRLITGIVGVGVGWNSVEFAGLNADFHTRGRRMAE